MKKTSQKFIRLLNNAQKLFDGEHWSGALALLHKADQIEAENFTILFQLGWSHMKMKQETLALEYFSRVELIVWHNPIALNSVAVAYILLKKWKSALKVLLQAMALDKSNIDTYVNLSSVYKNIGENKESLTVALQGIMVKASEVGLHVNMGSALLEMGYLHEAQIAFETCLTLQADCMDAHLNLAVILGLGKKPKQAIDYYQKYIAMADPAGHDKVNVARYYLSYQLLKLGQLKQGWELYEYGFDSAVPSLGSRAPTRQFTVPRWEGQPIAGKRLLVWAEQGLGDEILFLSCLKDVLTTCTDVILECAPRLIAVMARSFPTVTVRATAYQPNNFNQSVFHDFDYQIPMGSLPRLYRQSLLDFQRSRPFIITNEKQKARFTDGLSAFEGKLKVGISWRSGLLAANRNADYSAIQDWGELLQLPNCVFVNLQYGDCEAELTEVEALFGISIVRWQDLDLKNDIDEVFALMACLDVVVTAPTTVHAIAGSLGKPTLLMQGFWDWTNLGTDFFPWYASTRCFVPSMGQSPAAILPEVAALVDQMSALNHR